VELLGEQERAVVQLDRIVDPASVDEEAGGPVEGAEGRPAPSRSSIDVASGQPNQPPSV
jgi:hypothetical protein